MTVYIHINDCGVCYGGKQSVAEDEGSRKMGCFNL